MGEIVHRSNKRGSRVTIIDGHNFSSDAENIQKSWMQNKILMQCIQ